MNTHFESLCAIWDEDPRFSPLSIMMRTGLHPIEIYDPGVQITPCVNNPSAFIGTSPHILTFDSDEYRRSIGFSPDQGVLFCQSGSYGNASYRHIKPITGKNVESIIEHIQTVRASTSADPSTAAQALEDSFLSIAPYALPMHWLRGTASTTAVLVGLYASVVGAHWVGPYTVDEKIRCVLGTYR